MANVALDRSVVVILTNKSGGAVAQGDVVRLDTSTAASFTTTTTAAYAAEPVGVVVDPAGIANNGLGRVCFVGVVPKVNLSASASLGDFFATHTVAGQAARHATPATAGDFGMVLGTGTTPLAFLFGTNFVAGGGGGGATIGTGDVASLPSPGTSGDAYFPTDGVQIYRSDGVAQFAWGPVYPFTPPDDATFAWRNQGGASVDATFGGIYLAGPAGTANLRIREINIPSAPYVMTICLIPRFMDTAQEAGLCLVESGSGKLQVLTIADYYAPVYDWTNVTTISTFHASVSSAGFGAGLPVWLRVEDDSANRIWSISVDGQHFNVLYSVGNTSFITPDKVGYYFNSNSASVDGAVTLMSWLET